MKIAQNKYRRNKLELDKVSKISQKYKNLSNEYKELQAEAEKMHKFDRDNEAIEKRNTKNDGFDGLKLDSSSSLNIENYCNYRRSIIKNSKCMGKKLERYFDIIDQDTFSYYAKPEDTKPKKNIEMLNLKAETQWKDTLNATELKTWADDKDKKYYVRLKIGILQKKDKYRFVYFYSNNIFEIDYLKLQIESKFLLSLGGLIHEANQIFKTNVCFKTMDQLLAVPVVHKEIVKAKPKLAPKNKWLFDSNALTYVTKDNKEYGKSIKVGKILFGDDGMQFIDDSKPDQGFTIDDYDSLHYLRFTRK